MTPSARWPATMRTDVSGMGYWYAGDSDERAAVSICRVLLQRTIRAGTHSPYDLEVVSNVSVALQMITEPVGHPYPLPGPQAAIAFLWETARRGACPYRNTVLPLLQAYASAEWLPQREWLVPRVAYRDGMPDRSELHVVEVASLPYPHNFTPRCGNAEPHRQLVEQKLADIEREQPFMSAAQRRGLAVQ